MKRLSRVPYLGILMPVGIRLKNRFAFSVFFKIFASQMRTLIVHKAPWSLYTPQCDFRGIDMSNLLKSGRYVSILN